MKKSGVLRNIMLFLICFVGLVNFLAPFFTNYKTDPLITYIFMGTASALAGYQGLVSGALKHVGLKNDGGAKETEKS